MRLPLILTTITTGTPAPIAPWYLTGGVDPANVMAVYEPAEAADYSASLVNIANPGTGDAAEGVAPGFTVGAGWIFNGSDDYLIGPSLNGNSFTVIVKTFYDGNDDGVIAGWFGDDWSNKLKLYQDAQWRKMRFDWGAGAGSLSPDEVNYTESHNIIALTTTHCYINGVEQDFTPATAPGDHAEIAFIGAYNYLGSPNTYLNIGIEMMAFYNAILTPSQIAAIGATWDNYHARTYKTMIFYGDSISDPTNGHPWLLWEASRDYGPLSDMKKYTRPGTAVIYEDRPFSALVDTQEAAGINTWSNKVVILIGTNDSAAVATFAAELQKQVARIITINPNADIYLLGILNRFDEYSTRRDTYNPAISQVATNLGVDYINTDGWIIEADTYDQLHPNDDGYAKITNNLKSYVFDL